MTSGTDVRYLCDGLTEDLISRLTALRGIRVLSFATITLASPQHQDPMEMAARLNARWLLQGTVAGDSAHRRVQVRLSEVGSHLVLWSLSFDLDLSRLVESQWLIVNQIADKLGLQLASRYHSPLDSAMRRKPQSVDAYLRARFQASRRDRKSLQTAVDLCNKALLAEPQSAEMLALLSELYTLSANYGLRIIENPGVHALDMATRAVDTDGQMPEAHIAMGLALRTSDFAKAVSSFRNALALHPANLVARHYLAHILVTQGRYSEAEKEERLALDIDPLHPISRAHLVRILVYSGKAEEAERELATLEQDHLSPLLSHSTNGWKFWCERKWQQAGDHLEIALRFDSANLFCREMYIDCLRRLGRFDEALKIVSSAESLDAISFVVLARISQVFADLKRTSEAMLFHQKAVSQLDSLAENWLNNRSAVYNYNRALVQLISSDVTSAKAHLQEAVENGFLHYAELQHRPDWHDILGTADCSRLRAIMKASTEANKHQDFIHSE
jgi:TolB-like protein